MIRSLSPDSEGGTTPTSPNLAPIPFEQPAKLKGRQRLLRGLQRISSSSSLEKISRNRSNERIYRPNNKASVSCISLGPPMSAYSASPSSCSSQLSNGFSTAPTSPGTPAGETSYFDPQTRLRILETDSPANGVTKSQLICDDVDAGGRVGPNAPPVRTLLFRYQITVRFVLKF